MRKKPTMHLVFEPAPDVSGLGDPDRCTRCGWPYAACEDRGCVPGNCSCRRDGRDCRCDQLAAADREAFRTLAMSDSEVLAHVEAQGLTVEGQVAVAIAAFNQALARLGG